ncbi:MAG TPA: class I SAM-dependent methyltransferase [Planctomycetota bacterium]
MPVQEHNVAVGARWSAAGKEYEEISRQIADSIQHAVDRLAPRKGEKVLDLATGTGWTARLVAASGAATTGVDIAADKIAAAKALGPATIDFQVGDAEALAFEDGAFDAVISTCGIQFVFRPEDAAAEVARVVRKGGRFVATLWTPESSVASMFKIFAKYMPPPPDPAKAPPSPFLWGRRERLHELLGGAFELGIETATSYYRTTEPADAWRAFRDSYGPSKALVASLDPARCKALEQDFLALHEGFRTEVGVLCPREYLLVSGRRK